MSVMLGSSLRVSAKRWGHAGHPGAERVGRCQGLADWASAAQATRKQSSPAQPVLRRPVLDRRRPASVSFDRVVEREADQAKTAPTAAAAAPTATKSKVSAAALKRLMKEYGPVAVAFHSSVFLTTLGSFYSLIDYGLDVASLVENIPVIANNLPHPSAGNLALAWGVTTVTGPFRGLATITLAPRVARFWWGREAKRKLKNAPKDTEAP